MEKLKNLVNPGSKKDDEIMYGSGQSDDPLQPGNSRVESINPGSGQGSHFSSDRNAGHDSLSPSSNPTDFSQYERNTTPGITQTGPATAQGASHGLREPFASRMPGGFEDDDAATTASVSSGIPGQSQSRSAKGGASDQLFTDKPLPHVPSSEGPGIGHGQESLTGHRYPDRSVESSSRYGDPSGSSHDATLGTGAVATTARHHEGPKRDNYAPDTDRSFPLGGSATSGGSGSSTADIHSSNFANKVDPQIKSDGSRTAGSFGHGSKRDAYGSSVAGPHSSNLGDRVDPRVDSDSSPTTGNADYGSNPGDYRSCTAVTSSADHSGFLGHDTGAGAGAVRSENTIATGHGPESWQHDHQRHGHRYEGDPCETEAVDAPGGPHFIPGPHVTDTANRLDPHVSSGFGDVGATGDSSRHRHGDHVHRGQENASAGGAATAGLEALEADRRNKGTTGNATSSGLDPSSAGHHGSSTTEGGLYNDKGGITTGISPTGKTAGPHKSDTLNRSDPLVDSDLSKQQASHKIDHHYGLDAALAGAGGAGLHKTEKDHHKIPNLPTSSTTLGTGGHGPHDSEVNAVGTKLSRDEPAVSSAGSGQQPATTPDHHHKRDAPLVGAGGIGASEAVNHLSSSDHSNLATTPQDQLAGSGRQSTTGADPSFYPSPSDSRGHQSGTYTVPERQESRVSTATYPYPGHSNDSEKERHTGYQTGRDAAIIGDGTAGVGSLASHEQSQRHTADYGNEPYHSQLPGSHSSREAAISGEAGTESRPYEEPQHGHHFGKDTGAVGGERAGTGALAGYERSPRDAGGYGAEPYQSTSREHHTGRDAAILGGAAGAGSLAEHEYNTKDASKLQKEHDKEEKALERQHAKEIKHHDKELAKEEKAREKAIERSEKKHEKTMEKDDRQHEKAVEGDETKQGHGGKKHGGLLGFLHRDKPDKELKEEEAHRQAATHRKEGEMVGGAGAAGIESRHGYDPLRDEHGSQSGVHDTPIGIGSGLTTHDAYGAHDSGHNKLHKDPPPKVIESRGYDIK